MRKVLLIGRRIGVIGTLVVALCISIAVLPHSIAHALQSFPNEAIAKAGLDEVGTKSTDWLERAGRMHQECATVGESGRWDISRRWTWTALRLH